MRIGIVTPYVSLSINQPEVGLAEQLSKMGHKVTIIASDSGMYKLGEKYARDHEKLPYNILRLPTLLNIGEFPVVKGIKMAIKESDFDVVHANDDFQHISISSCSACKELNIPFVYTQEGYYIPAFPKGLIFYMIMQTLSRIVKNNAAVINARSVASMEFLVKYGAKKDKIKLIPEGIDTNRYKPTDKNFREYYGIEDRFTIGTISRLTRSKSICTVVEAANILKKEMKDFVLIIHGKGKERQDLIKLVKKYELSDNVIFSERKFSNEEMPMLYSTFDVYVLPSLVEPVGLSVLEAMSCGIPVVVTKVGGMKDFVKHGRNGFTVQPKDYVVLAEYLLRFSDKRTASAMGYNARETMVREYDWSVIAQRYIKELYMEAMK